MIRQSNRTAMVAMLVIASFIALAPALAHASRRVVIISIDGLRPDVALRAGMPALRSLMARGSFTMFASTTDTAVTIPSHMSMLTGVSPSQHGILSNRDPMPGQTLTPAWPTLFQLARRTGITTALSAGKSKFSVFVAGGVPDWSFVPPRGQTATDSAVAVAASRIVREHRPRFIFVHLAGPDLVGHAKGWGSPEQLAALGGADKALARVLVSLREAVPKDSTLIIVTSDHGGAGLSHGGLDARSHFIPWVVVGPGVNPGFDLTRIPALRVRTEDTFATACDWLGITIDKPIEGRAVSEIRGPIPTGR